MNAAFWFGFSLLATPLVASTVTGTVTKVDHPRRGGIEVFLVARQSSVGLTLYVPPSCAGAVGSIPPEGAQVTASGRMRAEKGRREMNIESAYQWKWPKVHGTTESGSGSSAAVTAGDRRAPVESDSTPTVITIRGMANAGTPLGSRPHQRLIPVNQTNGDDADSSHSGQQDMSR